MSKLKEPTTYDEQIEKLKARNIVISDRQDCFDFLNCISYYRFTAYYLQFKGPDDKCRTNVDFTTLKRIYEFDKKMRSLIMINIEDIEIYIKTKMAYYLAHTYGADGYLDPKIYNTRHNHKKFLDRISLCIDENKNTRIVKHHIKKYSGKFPIWVIIEFFSIGMISHMYRDLNAGDRKAIAKRLNVNYIVLESWLRCITDLRNKCAHYSRLYYTIFTAVPKVPTGVSFVSGRKLFSQLYMLKQIYPDALNWNANFVIPLSELIAEYKDDIDLTCMEFPNDWQETLTK